MKLNKPETVMSVLRAKGHETSIDEETQSQCFYHTAIKPFYVIEWWTDNKDGVEGYFVFHKQTPNIKKRFFVLDEALTFCQDMNEQLKALEGKK